MQIDKNENNSNYLKVSSKTWGRDSHGLFDYESNQVRTNLLIVANDCKLVRKRNDVKQLAENTEIEIEDRELAKVRILGNKYFLTNEISFRMRPTETNINDLQNKIWYVIKQEDINPPNYITNDVYDIKINDVIKLGRVKYVITEMKLNNKIQTIENDVINPVFNLIGDDNKNISPDTICKICLSNQEEDQNPMVNICKCTGSISCVHYTCLKSWMQTKLAIKENDKKTVTSYNMKSFNCEICKWPYPLRFKYDNIPFDIIDYKRPTDSNYIILESLNQLKDNNNYKSIQVINLEEGIKIVMGRGHDTDVRINDISVSRTHAQLSLVNNKIFIKDLKSKFGTLVLIQQPYEITQKPVCLQIGRTYAECCIIDNKEFLNIKKDVSVNYNEKTKNKQLFQVEKPLEKKEGSNSKIKYSNPNLMDVDSLFLGNDIHSSSLNLFVNNILNKNSIVKNDENKS